MQRAGASAGGLGASFPSPGRLSSFTGIPVGVRGHAPSALNPFLGVYVTFGRFGVIACFSSREMSFVRHKTASLWLLHIGKAEYIHVVNFSE